MLALAPSRNTKNEGDKTQSFSIRGGSGDDFLDFSGDNLLEAIDFGDLFDGMEYEVYEDVLPDLEMDPEILAEFSVSVGDDFGKIDENLRNKNQEEENQVSGSGNRSGSSCLTQGEEIGSKRDESVAAKSSAKEAGKERKSSKNHQGKRKVKVDWTPELHRRFVQAVEQLGVDKAVPSRILELMGIDCLTRHNIASHLQKYRSHRKHMLAREAEAASWTQRRQMSVAATRGGCKRERTSPWVAPTIGFTPLAPVSHFRPLHVWGHPSMDQSLMHVWPKHLAPSQSPSPHIWPPAGPSPHLPQPPMDPSFWHSRHQRVPNSLTPGTPCFPPPSLAPTRFTAPPVHGIPPHAMYKVDPSAGVPTAPAGQICPHPPDFHPSKESVDAAIGDALSKPWLPLPLGLKPPSSDSVVVELHRQGIEKIPPTCA